MKKITLQHNPTHQRLLLFFAGWGMDEQPFVHLRGGDMDVEMFFDYTTLTDFDFRQISVKYPSISVIAWSLGIYHANRLLHNSGIKFDHAVALNGTLRAIDDQYGLPKTVFEKTRDNLNPINLNKFNRRMNDTRSTIEFFEAHKPQRTLNDQHLELQVIGERFEQHGYIENKIFQRAIIGQRDRIFTPAAQQSFWESENIPIAQYDGPHYIFDRFVSFEEILNLG